MMKILFLFILLFTYSVLPAQISFQFVPELSGRNIDGLFTVKLVNTSTSFVEGDLIIKIKAKGQGEVLNVLTRGITLYPGVNSLHPSQVSKASIGFSGSNLSRIVKQSGTFPEAEYEYCFTVEKNKSGGLLLGDECFDYKLEPLSPLSLLEPYHTQKICDRKPALVWQPVFPVINGLLYQATLVELKANQNPAEALFYNIPVLNVKNLFSSYLPYPSIAPALDTGKTYVWQVTAYKGNLIVSRSEIWTFKVGCENNAAVNNPPDGYRNIEDLAKGNYYVAEGAVLFAMDNPYGEMELKYSIGCLTEPEMKIKKLPKTFLQRGRNNVLIDLDNAKYFKDGYSYIMNIQMPNGIGKTLRFVYKQK